MDRKEFLTNEKIKSKFTSQFDLVNYAISLAANMIMSGRDCRVKIDSQNRAMQILSEIFQEKDSFDDIIVDETAEQKYNFDNSQNNRHSQTAPEAKEPKERKKTRKALVD